MPSNQRLCEGITLSATIYTLICRLVYNKLQLLVSVWWEKQKGALHPSSVNSMELLLVNSSEYYLFQCAQQVFTGLLTKNIFSQFLWAVSKNWVKVVRSGLLWIIYYSTFKDICKLCIFCNARGCFDNKNVGGFLLRLDRNEEGHFRLLHQVK